MPKRRPRTEPEARADSGVARMDKRVLAGTAIALCAVVSGVFALRATWVIEDYTSLHAIVDIFSVGAIVGGLAYVVGGVAVLLASARTSSNNDRSQSAPRISNARKLLFTAILTGLCCVTLELGLSTLYYYSFIEPRTVWVHEHTPGKTTIQFDAIRGYKLSPAATRWACLGTDGVVQTVGTLKGNAQGFPDQHDFTIHRSKPDETRWAVFGDSFTAGQYLTTNWPDKAEELSSDDTNLKLLNFAVDGAGLANWWSILRRILEQEQYELDGVIFAVYGGDLWRPFYVCDDSVESKCGDHRHRANAYAGWDPRFFPTSLAEIKSEMYPIYDEYMVSPAGFDAALQGEFRPAHQVFRPYLVERFRATWDAVQNPLPTSPPKWTPEQQFVIADIAAFLKQTQLSAIVVHVPSRRTVVHNNPHPYAAKESEQFATVIGARFIDGTDAFKTLSAEQRRESWLPYDAHWSQIGSDRFAQFVLKKLTNN